VRLRRRQSETSPVTSQAIGGYVELLAVDVLVERIETGGEHHYQVMSWTTVGVCCTKW